MFYHWYNTSGLISKLDNSFSMTSLDQSFIFGGKTIIQFWKRIHSSMKQVLKVAFDFNLYFLLNFMKLYIPWISFVYKLLQGYYMHLTGTVTWSFQWKNGQPSWSYVLWYEIEIDVYWNFDIDRDFNSIWKPFLYLIFFILFHICLRIFFKVSVKKKSKTLKCKMMGKILYLLHN